MTGNKVLDYIICAINLAGCFIGLSCLIYTEMIYKRPLPDAEYELKRLKQESRQSNNEKSYELDRVVVNLHSRNTLLRYLEIEVHLFPTKQKYLQLFDKKREFIYDTLIDLASQMAPEDINSITGKILFEGEIKKRFLDEFRTPIVKNVYFSKFIVQ